MRYRIYSIGELPLLKLHAIGYSADISGTTFISRKVDTHLVGYVLSGKGIYNGNPVTVGQGFIFSPNIAENLYPDISDPLELLWFTSADPLFSSLLKHYNADSQTNIFSHSSPPELQYIKDLVIAENRNTISDGRMLELFFSVFKHHLSEGAPKSNEGAAPQRYLDFSVNYIKTHYNSDVSVSKLTELLGVSQPYLYKIFKASFGKSPKAFITEYRMNQAKKLLLEAKLSIAETALSVGYSDSFSFSKSFSSIHGCSPSEYRNIHK